MPPLTHTLVGWCAGNIARTTPKERFVCMVVSCIPDMDGLNLLAEREAYQHYHHLLTHSLLSAIVAALVSMFIAKSAPKMGCLYFILFYLHLLCDLLGSGSSWGIAYFWPFSPRCVATEFAWEDRSPQNFAVLVFLLFWSLWIAIRVRRTPSQVYSSKIQCAVAQDWFQADLLRLAQ